MKKYLMTGVAAIALCAAFTSCSKNEELYNPEQIEKNAIAQVYENYNQSFIAAFGQPAANHNWGFVNYSAMARTRANEGRVIKPDMTDFPGYSNERCNSSNYRSPEGYADIVAPVTDKEREWVMNWFANNPGLTEQGLDIHNFFVQNVGNNGHTKAGYFHSTEGGKPEETTAQNYDGIYMDKLQIGGTATEADTDHTLDFNATNGFNAWNLIYYENSSALQFGYHESYGNSYEWYFKCVELEVPGSCFSDGKARKGWYVGLSYYCNKQETNEKWHVIGGDRLQYGDDWVLKIVPAEPIPSDWDLRIIAEDLNDKMIESQGDPDDSDWDFNDVVLDVKFLEGTDNVRIRVTAAGATLPIRINGEDALEVHGLYGQPTNIMINTGAAAAGYPAQAYEEKYPAAATFERTISGVDDSYGKMIKIEVQKTVNGEKKWFELEAKPGQPASKMGVMPDYTYCTERQDIRGRYSKFISWVTRQNPVFWWRNL